MTKEAGLAVTMYGMGATVGDYDNDGWPDLFITGVGGNHLFHNEGDTNGVDWSATSWRRRRRPASAGPAVGRTSRPAISSPGTNRSVLDLGVVSRLRR